MEGKKGGVGRMDNREGKKKGKTKEKDGTRNRICGDCVHYYACSAWNVGSLLHTDAATCANYERVMADNG